MKQTIQCQTFAVEIQDRLYETYYTSLDVAAEIQDRVYETYSTLLGVAVETRQSL